MHGIHRTLFGVRYIIKDSHCNHNITGARLKTVCKNKNNKKGSEYVILTTHNKSRVDKIQYKTE
jgi:hypothetical protein